MRTKILIPLLLLVISCGSTASSQRPQGMPQPGVAVALTSPIFFGSGFTAPANLEVSVTNGGNAPLRVHEIEISSQLMTQYALYPVRRLINQSIAPGETKAFQVVATAYTNVSRLTPNEPLSVRAIVDFEVGNGRFREVYYMRSVGQ